MVIKMKIKYGLQKLFPNLICNPPPQKKTSTTKTGTIPCMDKKELNILDKQLHTLLIIFVFIGL